MRLPAPQGFSDDGSQPSEESPLWRRPAAQTLRPAPFLRDDDLTDQFAAIDAAEADAAVAATDLERRERERSLQPVWLLAAVIAICAMLSAPMRSWVAGNVDVATAATVFCGIVVQAIPFLALGVLLSGLIAVFVSPERLARWLPRRTSLSVVAAGVCGFALPGCECGSVPVARRLFGEGAAGAAALTFMLAAPAVNPVVLVSTAVAFPGKPEFVAARCIASLITALVMGALWARFGRTEWITARLAAAVDRDPARATENRWARVASASRQDFVSAGAYLVVGALIAAAMHVLIPTEVYQHLATNVILAVVMMAVLAFILSLCSEADAFVAASLTVLPLIPRLAFLVVGPAVDLKLVAMQAGMFGGSFAARFAPVTFVVAIVSACAVGALLLGGLS